MDEISLLENDIKYFELLDAALALLKCLRDGEQISPRALKARLAHVCEDREMFSLLNGYEFLLPFTQALAARELIIAVRENKENIDFEGLDTEEFRSIIADIFKGYDDIPTDEASKILTEICNQLAHGKVPELFDFAKLKQHLIETRRITKSNPSPVLRQLYSIRGANSQNEFIAFTSQYVSRFRIDEDGKKVRRDEPKVLEIEMDFYKLMRLSTLIISNFSKDIEASNGSEDYFFMPFIGLSMPGGRVKMAYDFDSTQREDYSNIAKQYLAMCPPLDPAYCEDVALSKIITHPINKISHLVKLINFFPALIKARDRDEVMDLAYKRCKAKGLDDYNACAIAFDFNVDNLYTEYLLTDVLFLLMELEDKQLLEKLASSAIMTDIAKDVLGAEDGDEKAGLKVAKTLRNALVHGRYINNANQTIDIYDEKETKKRTKESKKDVEFKFGLALDDLEDIKALCEKELENHQIELRASASNLSD